MTMQTIHAEYAEHFQNTTGCDPMTFEDWIAIDANDRPGVAKVTVRGRNGYDYDATPVKGELFIVGKFIVEVIDGKCERTICKATKANVAKYSK